MRKQADSKPDSAAPATPGTELEALAQQREKYHRSFMVCPVGLAISRLKDGGFLETNQAFARIFGYQPEQMKGRTSVELGLYASTAERDRMLARLAKYGSVREQELRLRNRQGRRVVILWTADLIEVAGEKFIVSTGLDITGQVEESESLRKSQTTQSALLNAIDAAVFLMEPDGTILAANQSTARHLGIPLEKLIGKSGFELQEPGKSVRRREIVSQVLESGRPVHFADERRGRIMQNSMQPVFDAQGGVASLAILGVDITEQRRMQEELARHRDDLEGLVGERTAQLEKANRRLLREVEERKATECALAGRLDYEKALAACSQALLSGGNTRRDLKRALGHLLNATRANRIYLFANQQDSVLGLCARQSLEVRAEGPAPPVEHPLRGLLPYDPDFIRWREVLNQGGVICGTVDDMPLSERALLRSQRIVSILTLPIFRAGAWYGFIGFDDLKEKRIWSDNDISMLKTAAEMIGAHLERMNSERALAQNEAFLSDVFNAIQDGILVMDPNFTIQRANRWLESRYTDQMPLVGKKCYQVFRWRDSICPNCPAQASLFTGQAHTAVAPYPPPQHLDMWLERSSFPLRGQDGSLAGVIVYTKDVSEQRRAEDALRQMAAGVAHNFNNVLMAVAGNAQAASGLLDRADPGQREAAGLLDNVVRGAASGRDVARRLAAYVAREQDMVPRREVLDLAGLAGQAIQLAFPGGGAADSRIRVGNQLAGGLLVEGVAGELVEVFLNLINNAKEAMPQGGELWIEGGAEGDRAVVRLHDTGTGLGPEELRKVFEPFFTTKGSRGQGLGLASSQGIIKAHGGEISVRSAAGQGACFTISLPLSEGHAHPAPTQATLEPAPGLEVLLVEDEALVAMGLVPLLENAGHHVTLAGGVEEAGELALESRPDVVLCDFGLPDGTAWDVAGRLAAQAGQGRATAPPMVVLTGWGEGQLPVPRPEGVGRPAAVLQKPVDQRELLQALCRVARR